VLVASGHAGYADLHGPDRIANPRQRDVGAYTASVTDSPWGNAGFRACKANDRYRDTEIACC
jgi:hypothetical protein